MRPSNRFALGTAQFGLSYGIANAHGQVPVEEVKRIINYARQVGIDTLDTAMLYGESESVLGLQDLSKFSVVTKLREVPGDLSDLSEWILSQVAESLKRLGLQTLDGLLLHRPEQLLQPIGPELYEAMKMVRSQGMVRRIGVSIYSPQELDLLCSNYHFDLVQAPFNILDRRLLHSGWLQKLDDMGTAVHVRSAFMQGLLLMSKSQRPGKFSRWDSLWEQWDQWLADNDQSAVKACLDFVFSMPQIERVVVGVDSKEHLKTILETPQDPGIPPPDNLISNDTELLNPSCWERL